MPLFSITSHQLLILILTLQSEKWHTPFEKAFIPYMNALTFSLNLICMIVFQMQNYGITRTLIGIQGHAAALYCHEHHLQQI